MAGAGRLARTGGYPQPALLPGGVRIKKDGVYI